MKKIFSSTPITLYTSYVKKTYFDPKIRRSIVSKPGQLNTTTYRFYSPRVPEPRNDNALPPLMRDVPFVWWSTFVGQLRMWFQVRAIQRKIDPEFDMQEFLQGAHKALTVISKQLSKKDFKALEPYIASESLSEIRENMRHFDNEQAKAVLISPADACITFPHRIRVHRFHRSNHESLLKNEPPPVQGPIVEIVVVYHVWRGSTLQEIQQRSAKALLNKEKVDSFLICNYTFQRDYSKPIRDSSSWDVTSLVYFCLNPSRTIRKDDDNNDDEGDSSKRRPRGRKRK